MGTDHGGWLLGIDVSIPRRYDYGVPLSRVNSPSGGFNSSKVRLWERAGDGIEDGTLFQFLEGTIMGLSL